jgi:hypothetical protein
MPTREEVLRGKTFKSDIEETGARVYYTLQRERE